MSRLVAWVLVALVAVSACTRPSVPVDSGPRLVSLAPAMTETLGVLGATDQLVGRSDWCTQPPQITQLPAVGSSLTPDLEGLANLRPTRVLTQKMPGGGDEALDAVAEVSRLEWLSLADVQASTRELGRLTGTGVAADALAERYGRVLTPSLTEGSPRVLAIIGSDGPAGDIFYVRSDSLHGTALNAAGGRNAIEAAPTGAPALTAERVIALDPDVILILDARELSDDEEAAAIARWQALRPVKAVVQGRVAVLDGPQLMSVGPGILDVVPRLRRAIAGDETGAGY